MLRLRTAIPNEDSVAPSVRQGSLPPSALLRHSFENVLATKSDQVSPPTPKPFGCLPRLRSAVGTCGNNSCVTAAARQRLYALQDSVCYSHGSAVWPILAQPFPSRHQAPHSLSGGVIVVIAFRAILAVLFHSFLATSFHQCPFVSSQATTCSDFAYGPGSTASRPLRPSDANIPPSTTLLSSAAAIIFS